MELPVAFLADSRKNVLNQLLGPHMLMRPPDFDEIGLDPEGFVGARSKVLATDRLDRLLPERPRTPLAEGLAATAQWVEAHLEQLMPETPQI